MIGHRLESAGTGALGRVRQSGNGRRDPGRRARRSAAAGDVTGRFLFPFLIVLRARLRFRRVRFLRRVLFDFNRWELGGFRHDRYILADWTF